MNELEDDQYFRAIDFMENDLIGGFGVLDRKMEFSRETSRGSDWGGFESLHSGKETLRAQSWLKDDTLILILEGRNDLLLSHKFVENELNVEASVNGIDEIRCVVKKFHRNYTKYEVGDTLLARIEVISEPYYTESDLESSEFIDRIMRLEYFVKSVVGTAK